MGNMSASRSYDGCVTQWGHTSIAYIMPYLEASNTFNWVNFQFTSTASGQFTAFRSKVNVLLCPDDTPNVNLTQSNFIATFDVSYAGMRGLTENLYYSWGTGATRPRTRVAAVRSTVKESSAPISPTPSPT